MIRNLRITTLADNMVMSRCLGQWGLSFLLEFVDSKDNYRKVIFDTGMHKQSLLENIKQLKVNLSDVDCIVLSHGHWDHTAATFEIVKSAGGVKVFAHPQTFLPRVYEDKNGKRRYHGVPKGEGLDEIEGAGGSVYLSANPVEITPGVWTTGQIKRSTLFESSLSLSKNERAIIIVDGKEIDDQVIDDQALWMNVKGKGPIVITGCAHAGVLNTIYQVKRMWGVEYIYGLIGGTHLIGRPENYLQQTIRGLKDVDLTLISPCHCTGFKAATKLWHAFPEAFILNYSGRIINFTNLPKDRMM